MRRKLGSRPPDMEEGVSQRHLVAAHQVGGGNRWGTILPAAAMEQNLAAGASGLLYEFAAALYQRLQGAVAEVRNRDMQPAKRLLSTNRTESVTFRTCVEAIGQKLRFIQSVPAPANEKIGQYFPKYGCHSVAPVRPDRLLQDRSSKPSFSWQQNPMGWVRGAGLFTDMYSARLLTTKSRT